MLVQIFDFKEQYAPKEKWLVKIEYFKSILLAPSFKGNQKSSMQERSP